MHKSSFIIFQLFLVIVASFAQNLDDCKKFVQKDGFKYLGSSSNGNLSRQSRAFDEYDYYVSINPATWNNALADCKAVFGPEANLVAIESADERDNLNILMEDYGSGNLYWTSGLYDPSSSIWRWATHNQPLAPWAPWDAGHPASSPNSIHRVVLAHTSRYQSYWRTVFNTQMHRYICELPKTTIAVPCYETNDLVIVLDSSGSIGAPNYDKAKCFVEKLAAAYSVHDPSRLGFITYSSTVTSVFNLNSPLSPASISTLILSAAYMAGGTATDQGINQAINQFAVSPRTVPLNLVVLTDGASGNPTATIAAANSAVARGIRTFSVGITPSIIQSELLAIAGGNSNHVFTTDNFDELIRLLTPLSLRMCPT